MGNNTKNESDISQESIGPLSIVSAVIWLIIAAPLLYFVQNSTFIELFSDGRSLIIQTAVGAVAGIVLGFAAILMMRFEMFRNIADEYYILRQLKKMTLSNGQITLVSVSAGISEEILFRGAIQPIIGIWLTSLLFIAVHGYIRINSLPKILFTGFTFLLSMILGWLFIVYGIFAAMIAHAVYDIIVLYKIVHYKSL